MSWSPEGMDPVTLVGKEGRFEGLIAFRGDAAIDGSVVGSIVAQGRLLLGPAARVRGPVQVDELWVAGRLDGDVRARRRIELAPSSEVVGHLRAPRIAVAEGSRFEGRLEMGAPDAGPSPLFPAA